MGRWSIQPSVITLSIISAHPVERKEIAPTFNIFIRRVWGRSTAVCMVDSTQQNSTVDHFEKRITGSNSRVLPENRKEIGQLGIFSVSCAQFFWRIQSVRKGQCDLPASLVGHCYRPLGLRESNRSFPPNFLNTDSTAAPIPKPKRGYTIGASFYTSV